MATGDVLSLILNVGAGATVTFQPAAGVEYVITSYYGDSGTKLTDGTIDVSQYPPTGFQTNVRIPIKNTCYWKQYNGGTAAVNYFIGGVQTKG